MKKIINDGLFVISAPSATGKTTIIQRLIKEFDGSLVKVITCTTRKKRSDEQDGIDYRFLSKERFQKFVTEGMFIEHSSVYSNLYGVLKADISKPGKKIISLDSSGVVNFKRLGVVAKYILIMPPSLEELKKRIQSRGSESEKEVNSRMEEAKKEMQEKELFDYVVVNDNLDLAIDTCKDIIIGR